MRRELKEQFNFDHVDELQLDDVEEAYDKMEFIRAYKSRDERVPFPVYCSTQLDHPTQWTIISDVELQYGAAFLSQRDITTQHIPGILRLFGSLVTYETSKQSGWMKKISETMPAVLVRFASSSRLGCGYRLLARCARHTFDSRMPPIEKETSKLILYKGEIGIHLVSKVPASMKSEIYQTEIVATPTKILCCRCTCQCGSQDNERIVCVHSLPLLLKLSVFIGECLGEHFLLELTACWNSAAWEKTAWSDSELKSMKRDIVAIMAADDPSFDPTSTVSLSIDTLLQKYQVGTDSEKKWQKRTHLPPKPSNLCPIYKIPFKSTTKLLEIGLKHESVTTTATIDTFNTNIPGCTEASLFEPNYVGVSLLMNASGCNSDELYEYAGFQLLRHRAENTTVSGNEICILKSQAESNWKRLKQLSKKRSHNINTGTQPRQKCRLVTVTPTPQLTKTPARSTVKQTTNHTPLSIQRPRNLFQPDNDRQPPSKRCNDSTTVEANAPPRKKRASMICAKCGRNNSPRSNAEHGNDVRFFSVPTYPAPIAAPTLDSFVKREGKILLRRYVLDRAGCSKDTDGKNMFVRTITLNG